MRLIIAVIALFAGVMIYGAQRNRQTRLAKEAQAVAVRDSIRRADSLVADARRQAVSDSTRRAALMAPYDSIQAAMGRRAAAQLAGQQGMAKMAEARGGAAAAAAATHRRP